MQKTQENQSKQFDEFLSNLTIAFNNLSQSGSKSHNSNNYPNGSSNSWCIFNKTTNHNFTNCVTLSKDLETP